MPPPNENPGQARAIAHVNGPIQVLAGPGSGKTFTIVKRILNLVDIQKIPPEKILVITFTKAAALEMQSRFLKEIRRSYSAVSFGTFHSIYYQIVSRSGYLTDFSLVSEFEKIKILRKILNHLFPSQTFSRSDYAEILNEISLLKNFERQNNPRKGFSDIYDEYCEMLKSSRKMDFDDMILFCYEMFNNDKKTLEKWQNYFSHILVDEFQDINSLQYMVLKQIAGPSYNLFVVGDDDQAIYGFRGANPGVMQDFLADFVDCEKVVLDTNYRSTRQIVTAASKVIITNKNRLSKDYQALRDNEEPVLLSFAKRDDEDNWLMKKINEYPPDSLKDKAIIMRTNFEVSVIASKCVSHGIKVRVKEKVNDIFSHFAVIDILDYLNFSHGSKERSLFLNIINKPMRYLSRKTVANLTGEITEEAVKDYYQGNFSAKAEIERFFTACRRITTLSPYLAINFVRKGIGYDRYLKGQAKPQDFAELMAICDELQETARSYETFNEWFEMIHGLKALANENAEKKTAAMDGLNIITMHSSKGLEFQTVFLPHLNEGTLPGPRALTNEQIEEERRLFYVGMTRAKDELYLTYTESAKYVPSRFLEPLY
ncbi:MAG: ATP-dependent helicase [Lachnospiraceae bacterium]|nr:ATP-dependent helicase [Lachnospiraceae bacterium]